MYLERLFREARSTGSKNVVPAAQMDRCGDIAVGDAGCHGEPTTSLDLLPGLRLPQLDR